MVALVKGFEEIVKKKVIEEVGHISADLTHDLRSPLQTIQNAVYLIERNPDNPLYTTLIKDSLKQASSILDGFRDYYKGHQVKPVDTHIQAILDLSLSEFEVPENIKLVKEIDEMDKIRCDPTKISHVFLKLIQNAIDAMPKGGEIKISIKNHEGKVVASVSDNGHGIKPEVMNDLFTPFSTKNKRGNGLGLPACKRIIETHGGKLTFDTVQGVGTTFTFSIPKK